MLEKFKSLKTSGTEILIFILRNMILYLLLFHAYLHFQGELNIVFLSTSFSIAIMLAILMEKLRLRFLPALVMAVITAFSLRWIIFFIFRVLSPLDPGLDKDFFYYYFDRNFFPALLPCFVAWLFTFAVFRKPGFISYEVGCNALLLILILFNQAQYSITLYHPTFFGIFLGLFIFIEVIILLLAQGRKRQQLEKRKKYKTIKRIFSYIWIIIPLFFLLLLYFFLLDKYNKDSAKTRGGLMESTMFRFDFSKYIKLQSEIKLSNDLVMIMRKNGPASRLLLRRFVLSEYQPGGGFYQSKRKGIDDIPVIVPDSSQDLPDPGYAEREKVSQDYFFVNLDPTSLIAMNYPVNIIPLKNWDDSSFLRIYKVDSMVNQLDIDDEKLWETEEINMPDDLYRFYTYYGDDELIKEFAEEVTLYSSSYFEKVVDIQDYLQDNYLYSLKPGIAKDGDQLHHFLFKSKKGYCSYFAFAMALMCRSLGIPARVAVGFFANPDWEVLNFYEIRANQAHAWVEVYFEELGWIEFDPTSTTIAPGEDISFLFEFKLDERLKNLISEILENQDNLTEENRGTEEVLKQSRGLSFYALQISSWLLEYWFIILPVIYLVILLLIKYFHLIVSLTTKNHRKKIKSLFLFSLGRLYGLGILRRTDESLVEFANRIECDAQYHLSHLKPWVDSFLKAVFDREFSEVDFREAKQRYDNFRLVIKQNVSIIKRIAGFFNPMNSLRRKV